MNIWVVFTILALSSLSVVSGLKCYQCSYTSTAHYDDVKESNCGDPTKSGGSNYLSNCPELNQREVKDGAEVYCRSIRGKQVGSAMETIERSCYTSYVKKNTQCSTGDSPSNWHGMITSCFCQTDGCIDNHAGASGVGSNRVTGFSSLSLFLGALFVMLRL